MIKLRRNRQVTKIKEKKIIKNRSMKDKVIDRINYSNKILINMELISGNHRIFFVYPHSNGFKYYKRRYIIDQDSMYYVDSEGCYGLDYHQSLSLPIKRSINVKSIKDAVVERVKDENIEMSLNPDLLEGFMMSEVIRQLIRSLDVEESFKMLKFAVFMNLIGTVILIFMIFRYIKTPAG